MPTSSSMTSTGGRSQASSAAPSSFRVITFRSFMFVVPSRDVDPARQRRFLAFDADVKHAFPVGGSHFVGIEVIGQGDDPVKPPRKPLAQMNTQPIVLVGPLWLALSRDIQPPSFELNLDLLRIKPRGETVDLRRIRGTCHI